MTILVIAPQPFFTPRGTPLSVYYRTLVTAENASRVDLLTYGQGKDVAIPGVRIIRLPRFLWPWPVRTGPSLPKLYLDVFLFLWTIALLLRHRYSVVHAHEEAVFFCRFLKPLFRFRLVYDMHSSLPQQLANFNFSRSRILRGVFTWLENGSIRAADQVITICPALANHVLSLGTPAEKHVLIENSIFEPVMLSPSASGEKRDDPPWSPEAIRESLGLPPDCRLAVYAGTLEHYQGIDMLLAAFAEVRRQLDDVHLVICGGAASQVAHYRHLAAEAGVEDRCHLIGRVPHAHAQALNVAADVLLSPRTEGTNTPLKIYEQLASGVPLVATRIESHTQVLDDDIAFLVPPTTDGVARGMLAVLGDRERARRVAASARARYERDYARPAYEKKMRTLLSAVGACAE